MERWDEPKFAEVEARLKALPEDAWAPEDHYLMVEWTAQRHLSHDEPFTEREWAAAKVRIKHKVDAALEELGRGGDHGQVAWERRETERRRLADRFREPLLTLPDIGGYEQLLRVVWPYGGEEESGMPSDSDLQKLDEFEHLLCNALEGDGRAICTAVITTWGYREWVIYTDDFEECGERISRLPKKDRPYPIELEAEADEDWHYLRENILAGMGKG